MNNLPLHPTTKKRIDQIIKQLPHAVVFAGPKGVGTAIVAQMVAAALTPAIYTITPKKRTGLKLVEDYENGSIVIDDIRELYDQTRSKFTAPQLFIVDFGDRTMTHNAQNAFLKLLEEPQPNVHFILATQHPDLLLPTVLSRCQRIDILPVTDQQTNALLDDLHITDATKRARIAFIATGLAAEIYRLASDADYYDQRVQTVQDAKSVLEGSPYSKLLIVRKYKDQRPQALQLIDDMLIQLRRALERSQDGPILDQITGLIDAYEKIQINGNVQLQLARVLLR